MSSSLTEPVLAPQPPSPEPIERVPRRGLGWVAFLITLLIGGGVWLGISRLQEESAAARKPLMRTAAARLGSFDVLARVSGTSSAVNYSVVVAPRLRSPDADRAMSLIMLAGNGTNVHKGDVIAEFDATNIRDHIDDVKDMLEERRNYVKKLQVQHELQVVNLRQRLRVAQATAQKARLDLKTAAVRSRIQSENYKLAAEEADAVVKELLTQIELRKEAQASAMKIAKIDEKLQIDHVQRHVEDEQRLKVLAPIDGMVVVLARDSRHGERKNFEAGELVMPGTPMLQIVDRSSLQIEATINQSEVTRFRLGQKATVGFDAYPEKKYKGEISAIGALASLNGRQQYFIRTIPIRVKLEPTDEQIIPDLSGYANVVLDHIDDAVVIPEGAVEKAAEGAFVEVKSGDTFVRRAVQLGPGNGVDVSVREGLEEGEVVRLTQEK